MILTKYNPQWYLYKGKELRKKRVATPNFGQARFFPRDWEEESWQLAGEATRQEEELLAEEVTRHELLVPRLYRREISKLTQRQKCTKKSQFKDPAITIYMSESDDAFLYDTYMKQLICQTHHGSLFETRPSFRKRHLLSDKSDSGMSIFKYNDDDCISDMSASESDNNEPTQYGGGIPWRSLIPWRQRRGKFLLFFSSSSMHGPNEMGKLFCHHHWQLFLWHPCILASLVKK
jgi:hypothetical protein